MAIAEDVYARCQLCTTEAAAILTGMINGNKIDPIAVQARRTAADIAGDAAYALLGHAFITPIDREDLWLLREAAERVWCEAEEAALLLYHCDHQLPAACEPAVHMAAACCTAAGQIAEEFPNVTAAAKRLRVLREAQRTCHTTLCNCFADDTARRVCDKAYRVMAACEQLICALRYAAMKSG